MTLNLSPFPGTKPKYMHIYMYVCIHIYSNIQRCLKVGKNLEAVVFVKLQYLPMYKWKDISLCQLNHYFSASAINYP